MNWWGLADRKWRKEIIHVFFIECYCTTTILSMCVLILMLLWTIWIGNIFKPLFSQPTACILSSHLSKAIHMDSTPGTIAFSCQIVVSFEAHYLWMLLPECDYVTGYWQSRIMATMSDNIFLNITVSALHVDGNRDWLKPHFSVQQ